ncbi:MAG TPA: helix-turn-helix domain-containing protein [Longimicrobiales bacterium]|nr:helix-turn-helix domain-containing protein [Longimicrobiales bacterium]
MARPRFRPPRQARSQKSLDRILGAAERIAGERGLEAVTVQEVIQRSGVSVGSFYARFEGRDALLHHMQHRFWTDAEEQWRAFLDPARWDGVPASVLVGELVRILVRGYALRAPQLRAYLLYALAHPDGKPLRRATMLDEAVAERLLALLEPRLSEFAHPWPERAVPMAIRQLLATLREEVLFGRARPEGATLEEDDLVVELTRAFLGYLGVTGAPESTAELRRRVSAYREAAITPPAR